MMLEKLYIVLQKETKKKVTYKTIFFSCAKDVVGTFESNVFGLFTIITISNNGKKKKNIFEF
jgi:hypothetical protein